jgi:hypothetical protein
MFNWEDARFIAQDDPSVVLRANVVNEVVNPVKVIVLKDDLTLNVTINYNR